MRKKTLWRAASLALVLALTAGSLGACGSNREGDGGGGGSESTDGGNANGALARENVYRFQEVKLPDLGGDDNSLMASKCVADRIYLVMQAYNWDQDSLPAYYLVSMDTDGGDMQSVKLSLTPHETEQPEETDAPEETEQPEETDSTDETTDAEDSSWEYFHLFSFVFGDGCLYAVGDRQYNDYSDPENPIFEQENTLYSWTLEGELALLVPLEGMQTEEEFCYVNAMVPGTDGSVTLLLSGNTYYSQRVTPDGTLEGRKELDQEIGDLFNSSSYLTNTEPGKLLITYYDQENWERQFMTEFDLAAGTLSEPVELPSSMSWNGFSAVSKGLYTDMIYATPNGVFTYSAGNADAACKINFTNSDVFSTSTVGVVELDEDRIFAVFYENYEDGYVSGIFTRVPPEEVKEKKVLVLGSLWMDGSIRKRVVEFNRNNPDYRIVIKNYDEFNSYDDPNAAQTAMDNDIITGQMPDILYSHDGDMDKYAEKGWLADIGEKISQDEELSQTEFVQNVFDAYSTDGKLYMVIPEFCVRTMLGKKALVGDRTSWTMADLQQALASMPEGAQVYEDANRGYFMNVMMGYCGNDFINLETGECSFDSEEFIALMEFAKSLPETIEYDEDYWANYDYWSLFRQDKVLLCEVYIRDLRSMNSTINGQFGEPVSYVGFPTTNGPGGVIDISDVYCISAKSPYQDVAWEFVRYYLTEEYQAGDSFYNLPTRKDVFEKKAQEALQKPYSLDEDGNKVEYDETFYVGDEEIVLDPMTEEQLSQLVDYIYSVNKRDYGYNEDILNIIDEEMEAFYTDQKSAQEVAGLIQNRVQLFVDENS